MTSKKDKLTLTEDSLFETVLDNVCERLEDKQAEYSIRRLREMEVQLVNLEKELDELVRKGTMQQSFQPTLDKSALTEESPGGVYRYNVCHENPA